MTDLASEQDVAPRPAAPRPGDRLDIAAVWRAYTDVGARVDDLLDTRDALAQRLAEAEEELMRRQTEADEDEERLRAWHADAAEAWEALVQRVGRAAAGAYPEPAGTGEGNPQKHLVRAQRTVSAPIRFPMLKTALRMAAWGVLGGVLCCLVAFGLGRLVDAETIGTAAHVAAIVVAFAGLATAPFAGFALARWRLSATTDDDRTDPALAGLGGGIAVSLVWLVVTIATM